MAFSLNLPPPWPAQGWKVKIRDRERLEPPHVTIIRRSQCWRMDLRTGRFLDKEPDPTEVPDALKAVIQATWSTLCAEWDAMYPENPATSEDNSDE
jgi:hypothetical protein